MQLTLSAFLITMSLFLPNSCRILVSFLERLGLGVLSLGSSAMQGWIQDFVRGGAKPSDVRKTVAISAKIINS